MHKNKCENTILKDKMTFKLHVKLKPCKYQCTDEQINVFQVLDVDWLKMCPLKILSHYDL